MSEEEVNYASVVFKPGKHPPPEAEKNEETVYDEVRGQSKTSEQTADANGSSPGKKANRRRHYQQLACCLVILCVILVSGIIGVSVQLATYIKELNHLKENQTSLLADNNKLSSDNENLRMDHSNLTVQFDNLTQAYTVLESNITKVSAENQQLQTQNQQLQTQRNNLTQQIQDMQRNWNELNVSRAQWSIDAYCYKDTTVIDLSDRPCKHCQKGWEYTSPSCYVYNNAELPDRKTWEEAREDCKRKNAEFAVIHDQNEKDIINRYSPGNDGFWIGLRVEDGKWTWIDGSDLTDSSWIGPPTDGHCAVSIQSKGWESVSCDDKRQWICKKNALSL